MASIHSLPSLRFSALQSPFDGLHSRLNFRPRRVSSARATAGTTERTSSGIASPGSFYEVLGIQNGASLAEIKSAYRKLARVLHPDVAAEAQKENRALEFMKIHRAYETLSDPEKRAEYDLSLHRTVRSSPYMTSATAATIVNYAASGFSSRPPRRRWETDQCW